MRTFRQTTVVLLCLGATAVGLAEQYWVEYNAAHGNFPETEGWTRYTSGGGDTRYFDAGALVLEGQPGTHDAYAWFRPGELDPGPGEVFVARWRVCVSHIEPPYPLDPSVIIYSDQQRGIGFIFGYDRVRMDDGYYLPIVPGVFHEYELRSASMMTWDFYVDGVLAYSGESWASVSSSLVGWGDSSHQAGSVSRWAWFDFGVIPEPCSVWLVVVATLVRLRPRVLGRSARAPRAVASDDGGWPSGRPSSSSGDGVGFAGPYTLEIEGIEGEPRTERSVCDRIAESLGYLRGLGRV